LVKLAPESERALKKDELHQLLGVQTRAVDLPRLFCIENYSVRFQRPHRLPNVVDFPGQVGYQTRLGLLGRLSDFQSWEPNDRAAVRFPQFSYRSHPKAFAQVLLG